MSGEITLTLSGLRAAYELRSYIRGHPEVDTSSAIEALCSLRANATSLDFRSGSAIHELLPSELSLELSRTGLQDSIRTILELQPPMWTRFVPSGRDRVRLALDQDEAQCLREAGLFDPIPDEGVLAWWDKLAANERASVQLAIMEQAREAERLSMSFELTKLIDFGANLCPEWISIEDNTLGYDIRSFSLEEKEIRPVLIEVKSTKDGAFFVTKNEWANAITSANYIFHIWRFPERVLTVASVAEIGKHIPSNQGNGRWESVRVSSL